MSGWVDGETPEMPVWDGEVYLLGACGWRRGGEAPFIENYSTVEKECLAGDQIGGGCIQSILAGSPILH